MSTEDRELARLRAALVPVAENARPTADCPAPETVWAAAQGELKPAELRTVVDHLGMCLVCSEAWDVAEDMAASRAATQETNGIQTFAEVAPPPTKSSGIGLQGWLGLAVAAALLLTVVPQWAPWQNSGTVLRDPGQGEVRSLNSPDEPLSRQNFVLHWQGPAESTRYALRVTYATEDFRKILVEEDDLLEPKFVVPSERLQGVPSGARLTCYAEAFRGQESAAKGTFYVLVE